MPAVILSKRYVTCYDIVLAVVVSYFVNITMFFMLMYIVCRMLHMLELSLSLKRQKYIREIAYKDTQFTARRSIAFGNSLSEYAVCHIY